MKKRFNVLVINKSKYDVLMKLHEMINSFQNSDRSYKAVLNSFIRSDKPECESAGASIKQVFD